MHIHRYQKLQFCTHASDCFMIKDFIETGHGRNISFDQTSEFISISRAHARVLSVCPWVKWYLYWVFFVLSIINCHHKAWGIEVAVCLFTQQTTAQLRCTPTSEPSQINHWNALFTVCYLLFALYTVLKQTKNTYWCQELSEPSFCFVSMNLNLFRDQWKKGASQIKILRQGIMKEFVCFDVKLPFQA